MKMPKQPASKKSKLEGYVKEFGKDVLTCDGTILTCKVCMKPVNSEKKYFVQQHVSGAGHKALVAKNVGEKSVCLLTNFVSLSKRESEYHLDLCQMLVETGIPLYKVEHPSFRSFMEKHSKHPVVPRESTLRQGYLKKVYDAVVDEIRKAVGEHPIWITVDETTDVTGRHIANVVVGVLNADQPTTPFLLSSEVIEKVDSSTVAQVFTVALGVLWPNGICHRKVLLFLTDAARYMKKAADALKVLFPKMLHVTCVDHGLHRVAEEVRKQFPDVDSLISNVKKIFLKAPTRREKFKATAPDVPLPPQPITTRWGTWLEAAIYYAVHLETIKQVVDDLDFTHASSIELSQSLLSKPSLKFDLAFIRSHLSSVPKTITSLESAKLPLQESLKTLETVRNTLEAVPGKKGKCIVAKCKQVFGDNRELATLQWINSVLCGGNVDMNDDERFTADELAAYKYAPITTVDVERSFSKYKLLLSDRRHSFSPEHLKYHLVASCNANLFMSETVSDGE